MEDNDKLEVSQQAEPASFMSFPQRFAFSSLSSMLLWVKLVWHSSERMELVEVVSAFIGIASSQNTLTGQLLYWNYARRSVKANNVAT